MFWSGNYIVVRELNFLLKEENVSLSQVLEAEDILQECKANNKALIQFLTKPEILAELVTLITEEPPQHVDLMSQYRHASIACEVLTSQLSSLGDHLSLDTVQMHRLCDFINKEPPLNPLLASYFSKIIEMLLERNPQQDWYQYHIMCLRVLDFVKSRRDFLPNLLRHISTSAIADTFKHFIRVGDMCHKNVTEWLEENQFLECLIQIICGTYVPEPLGPPVAPSLQAGRAEHQGAKPRDQPEKAETEDNEKTTNHKEEDSSEDEIRVNNNMPNEVDTSDCSSTDGKPRSTVGVCNSSGEQSQLATIANDNKPGETHQDDVDNKERLRRMQAVASANAASLLCDIILTGCAADGCSNRHTRTSYELVAVLQREECVRGMLAGVFTAPPHHADIALLNGCRVLLALLQHGGNTEGGESCRGSVEVAAAPHLPLLHQALVRHPPHQKEGSGEAWPGRVGEARLQTAALLALLAASQAEEVAKTMITLGTPGAVVELVFRFPHNNLLHAHALALLRNALDNTAYRTQYARHLLVECDLLTRLMDAFEENEAKKRCPWSPRAAYMGHVVQMLSSVSLAVHPAHYDLGARLPLPPPLMARWRVFYDDTLRPLLHRLDTPLGGSYPSENVYDMENIELTEPATYDFNDMQTAALEAIEEFKEEQMCTMPGDEAGEDGGCDDDSAKNGIDEFKKMLSSCDKFSSDMWEDDLADADDVSKVVGDMYCSASPWDSADKSPNTTLEDCGVELVFEVGNSAAGSENTLTGAAAEGGWASFDAFCDAPVDPFTGEKVDTNQLRMDEAAWAAADKLDQTDQWDNFADETTEALEQKLMSMKLDQSQPLEDASIELANNLLTAMSSMAPSDIANIVNANLPPPTMSTPTMSETTMSESTMPASTISESMMSDSTLTSATQSESVTATSSMAQMVKCKTEGAGDLAEGRDAVISFKEVSSSESEKTEAKQNVITERLATDNDASKSWSNEPSTLTESKITLEPSTIGSQSYEPSQTETSITETSTRESNTTETSKSESAVPESLTTESAVTETSTIDSSTTDTSTADTSTSDYTES